MAVPGFSADRSLAPSGIGIRRPYRPVLTSGVVPLKMEDGCPSGVYVEGKCCSIVTLKCKPCWICIDKVLAE